MVSPDLIPSYEYAPDHEGQVGSKAWSVQRQLSTENEWM